MHMIVLYYSSDSMTQILEEVENKREVWPGLRQCEGLEREIYPGG